MFDRMRCHHCHHLFGISLQLITFWSLRIHDNVAGGREEEEVQLSLTVSCGRKYLSFFQDFLVRNLEIIMLICYQCRSSFFKTLGNYVFSKNTHPTISIQVLLLLILLSIIFLQTFCFLYHVMNEISHPRLVVSSSPSNRRGRGWRHDNCDLKGDR